MASDRRGLTAAQIEQALIECNNADRLIWGWATVNQPLADRIWPPPPPGKQTITAPYVLGGIVETPPNSA